MESKKKEVIELLDRAKSLVEQNETKSALFCVRAAMEILKGGLNG